MAGESSRLAESRICEHIDTRGELLCRVDPGDERHRCKLGWEGTVGKWTYSGTHGIMWLFM